MVNLEGSIKGDVKRKNLFRTDRRGFLGIEPSLGSACCRYGRAGDCEDSRLGIPHRCRRIGHIVRILGPTRAGSIKGDVKRKNLSRRDRRGFLGIEPSLGSAYRWRGRAGDCEDSRLGCCICSYLSGILRPHKPLWVGGCQPWFYLRLKAYGFVGLSEGAYGGP